MTRARLLSGMTAGLLAALLLGAASAWLLVHQPKIDTAGGTHTCLSPYDTVINGGDNTPAGNPEDADSIAARCHDTGQNQFWIGVPFGLAAIAVAVLSVVMTVRRRE